MKMRVFSWLVAALCVFGVVKAVQAFKNPWDVSLSSPVLSNLPPAAAGCGVKCLD